MCDIYQFTKFLMLDFPDYHTLMIYESQDALMCFIYRILKQFFYNKSTSCHQQKFNLLYFFKKSPHFYRHLNIFVTFIIFNVSICLYSSIRLKFGMGRLKIFQVQENHIKCYKNIDKKIFSGQQIHFLICPYVAFPKFWLQHTITF